MFLLTPERRIYGGLSQGHHISASLRYIWVMQREYQCIPW